MLVIHVFTAFASISAICFILISEILKIQLIAWKYWIKFAAIDMIRPSMSIAHNRHLSICNFYIFFNSHSNRFLILPLIWRHQKSKSIHIIKRVYINSKYMPNEWFFSIKCIICVIFSPKTISNHETLNLRSPPN